MHKLFTCCIDLKRQFLLLYLASLESLESLESFFITKTFLVLLGLVFIYYIKLQCFMADMILLGTISWVLGAKLLCSLFSLNVKPIRLELFNQTIRTFSYWSQFKIWSNFCHGHNCKWVQCKGKDMTQISFQAGP